MAHLPCRNTPNRQRSPLNAEKGINLVDWRDRAEVVAYYTREDNRSTTQAFSGGTTLLGRLTFDSILRRDYPTLLGILFCSALLVIAANLVTDLLYRLIDPRIRAGRPA